MRGCSPERGEGRKGPYMKKTPDDHAGGIMAGRSSVRRENRKRTEKNKIFSENFSGGRKMEGETVRRAVNRGLTGKMACQEPYTL